MITRKYNTPTINPIVIRKEKPPPPGNCSASKNFIFTKAIFIRKLQFASFTWQASIHKLHLANKRPRVRTPRACHFTTGVLIDSGRIIYRSGSNPGKVFADKVTDTARPDARENGTLPQVE